MVSTHWRLNITHYFSPYICMEAITLTPWNLAQGCLPRSGHFPGLTAQTLLSTFSRRIKVSEGCGQGFVNFWWKECLASETNGILPYSVLACTCTVGCKKTVVFPLVQSKRQGFIQDTWLVVGAMTKHCCLWGRGGLGACPPQKIFKFITCILDQF